MQVVGQARRIVEQEGFARLLGLALVEADEGRVVVKMPYREALGVGRVHGGAISALVDSAATAAFWAYSDLGESARGATVGFSINFLRLAVGVDLYAEARVRRRGGTISTGDVSVRDPDGNEVACAIVTYKLDPRSCTKCKTV